MFGQIILCQFPFSSGADSKARPALVLFDRDRDNVVCRITSALYAGPLDIALADWETSGLLKPSIARLDRIVTIEKTIIRRRLGVLSPQDTEAARTAWNQQMKL
ncbi:type II toxin-antitoxin system PemK/MazF family toxin [Methylomagnum sp.]